MIGHNAIEVKMLKYYKFKLILKCFTSWKKHTETQKYE